MEQSERLEWLIRTLLSERREYRDIAVPEDPADRFRLYRSLVNVR